MVPAREAGGEQTVDGVHAAIPATHGATIPNHSHEVCSSPPDCTKDASGCGNVKALRFRDSEYAEAACWLSICLLRGCWI